MSHTTQRYLINNLADGNTTANSQGAGTVRQAKKTGTGTSTMTPGGSYIGAGNLTFTVICDAAGSVDGAATIKWKTSDTAAGSWEATGVSAVSTSMSLQDGITIQFSSGTLVLNDKWQFPAYAEYGLDNLFVNSRDKYWKSGALANIISNGGFDSNTYYWGASNCTLASVAGGQSGNCLEMTVTGGATQVAAQSITTVIGEKYRVILWVKSGTSGDEAFYISISGAVGLIINSTTTSTWTRHTATFVATATPHNFNIVKNTVTAGTMLFDTVSVIQIPSLEINLGSAVAVDTLALTDHNLSSSAIVTVDFNSSDSWSSPADSETLLNGANTDPYIEYVDYTYQYHKWFFDDVENADGFISIGKLYDGTYSELSGNLKNIPWGSAKADSLATSNNISDYGIVTEYVYSRFKAFTTQYFPTRTSSDLTTLESIWAATFDITTGQRKSIFVHYWYDTVNTLYLCRCASKALTTEYPNYAHYGVTLEWQQEVITRTI